MAKFRTKARAVELLGKNQIADLPTAITELWKNGYDAYGDNFHADLYCTGYEDIKNDTFCIKDDGFGMSYDDLMSKWIVLGTDSKFLKENKVKEKDRLGKEERITLGEKGIGRLSAAFLGDHMLMVTKKENEKFQSLFINWKIVQNHNAFLEDLDIPIINFSEFDELNYIYKKLLDSFSENLDLSCWGEDLHVMALKQEIKSEITKYSEIPNCIFSDTKKWFDDYKHGTVFIIFNPIEQISSIKSEGLKTDDSGNQYLYSALSGLFNPFDEKYARYVDTAIDIGPKLNIYTKEKRYNILDNKDFFTRDNLDMCEHWIKGEFDDFGQFSGQIKVDNEIIDYFWRPSRNLSETSYMKFIIEIGFMEGQSNISSLSPEQYSEYERKLDNYSGIIIYRDGFRVLPYGKHDADFLEFEYRRSKRAGTYYFSHRKMFGYIGISKLVNTQLLDKAGREGLTNNKAYREFKADLMAFFIDLAKKYYGSSTELKTIRDMRKSEEKARKAKEQLEFERRKKIEEEDKKRSQKLNDFRDELKTRTKTLTKFSEDIINYINLNRINSSDFKINDLNQVIFFSDLKQFEKVLDSFRLIIDETLPYRERDKDRINDYYEMFDDALEHIEFIKNKFMESSNIINLINTYKESYSDYCGELNRINSSLSIKIDNTAEYLKSEIFDWANNYKKKILVNPQKISETNISENEVKEAIRFLDTMKRETWSSIDKVSKKIEVLAEIAQSSSGIDVIDAYKIEYNRMQKTVAELHELAQLGISIELIDHQFNVHYGAIHSSLVQLSRRKNLTDDGDYKTLVNAFNHLEGNHKLLVPLYRSMRRTKKQISGKEILETVMKFYDDVFEESAIEVIAEVDFLNYKIESYESILQPVFVNIVNNALYWTRKSDKKIIHFKVNDDNEILVINSGERMGHSELENCFDLFYSKKPNGRGMGMYLARTNLRSVGLDIYATNEPEYNIYDGACFVIRVFMKENKNV